MHARTSSEIPFETGWTKVSDADKERTERPISANEITSAINSMAGKAPGDDGLTTTFYRKFWQNLVECLKECISSGEMTHSQPRSVIRLIQKKGKDAKFIKNWHPISLINVDTKIFSKCLDLDYP